MVTKMTTAAIAPIAIGIIITLMEIILILLPRGISFENPLRIEPM